MPKPPLPAAPKPRQTLRRAWVSLQRLCLLLVVLLAGAEIGLRVAGVEERLPTFCTWNPRMGCVTQANLHEFLVLDGRHFAFTTNANGLRGGEIAPKTPGLRRVLVLGDSVTFAPQVPDDAPFPNLLGLDLFKNHIDVVNGGSVYLRAADQQLSWYLDVGAALRPDLVVLEFTERNDFSDAQHAYWWRPGQHGLERQTRVVPPAQHPWVLRANEWPIVHWLVEHSRLFGVFCVNYWNIMHLPRVETNQRLRAATEDVLLRMRDEVTARGARFAVLVYPSPDTLAGMRGERPLRADNDNARILAIVKDRQIPYLDLTPAMAQESARAWTDGFGHLTVAGHRAVADLLAPQIRAWLGSDTR